MDISDLRSWLDRYGSAWQERDPAAAARLFSENASYFETPYADPFEGRDGVQRYWSNVTADQRNVRFQSEPVGVVDGTGIAKWSATFDLASTGGRVELNGVFLLEFDDQGLCRTLREWWHAR